MNRAAIILSAVLSSCTAMPVPAVTPCESLAPVARQIDAMYRQGASERFAAAFWRSRSETPDAVRGLAVLFVRVRYAAPEMAAAKYVPTVVALCEVLFNAEAIPLIGEPPKWALHPAPRQWVRQ